MVSMYEDVPSLKPKGSSTVKIPFFLMSESFESWEQSCTTSTAYNNLPRQPSFRPQKTLQKIIASAIYWAGSSKIGQIVAGLGYCA